MRLCEQHRHRRRRARDPHVAMDEQVALAAIGRLPFEFPAEFQDGFDILRLRRDHTKLRLEDIVEAQRDTMVLVIGPECAWLRRAGIEQRQYVGDAALAMGLKLFQPAYGQERKGRGFHHLLP